MKQTPGSNSSNLIQLTAQELDELRQMKADVAYVKDRMAILDCIMRYCRGLDRHDPELIASAFHPDAVDNHGHNTHYRPEFVKLRNANHNLSALAHTHNITTHSCEITGDVAHAESYVLFGTRHKNGETVTLGGARYIDRLERREGEWRISLRRLVIEWRAECDGRGLTQGKPFPLLGTWDRTDVSYQRPLTLPRELQERLEAASPQPPPANGVR